MCYSSMPIPLCRKWQHTPLEVWIFIDNQGIRQPKRYRPRLKRVNYLFLYSNGQEGYSLVSTRIHIKEQKWIFKIITRVFLWCLVSSISVLELWALMLTSNLFCRLHRERERESKVQCRSFNSIFCEFFHTNQALLTHSLLLQSSYLAKRPPIFSSRRKIK